VNSNEEFQKTVLEEFKKLNERIGNLEQGQESLKHGQTKLERRQENLEQGQAKVLQRQENLEKGQDAIKKDLKDVIAQTADLTEFRAEMNTKLDKVINDVSTIEIVTSKNWNDLARLKSVK